MAGIGDDNARYVRRINLRTDRWYIPGPFGQTEWLLKADQLPLFAYGLRNTSVACAATIPLRYQTSSGRRR